MNTSLNDYYKSITKLVVDWPGVGDCPSSWPHYPPSTAARTWPAWCRTSRESCPVQHIGDVYVLVTVSSLLEMRVATESSLGCITSVTAASPDLNLNRCWRVWPLMWQSRILTHSDQHWSQPLRPVPGDHFDEQIHVPNHAEPVNERVLVEEQNSHINEIIFGVQSLISISDDVYCAW